MAGGSIGLYANVRKGLKGNPKEGSPKNRVGIKILQWWVCSYSFPTTFDHGRCKLGEAAPAQGTRA